MFLKQFKDAIRDADGQFDPALEILLAQSSEDLKQLRTNDFVFIKRVLDKLKTKNVSRDKLKQALHKIDFVEKQTGRKKLVLEASDSAAELVQRLLKMACSLKAEVLHLRGDRKPIVRLSGQLQELADQPLMDDESLLSVATEVLSTAHMAELKQERMVSFSLSMAGISRFRVNAWYEDSRLAMSFKQIPFDLPELEAMEFTRELSAALQELSQGIVLVCGPAVSGKSTTCAAILNWLNQTKAVRVLTLEQPIEYLFRDQIASVTQREVGSDLNSFEDGLRYALKGGPDWIFLSEIASRGNLEFAINAAENGKVVLTTVAAVSTAQALETLAAYISSDGITLMERFSNSLSVAMTQNLGPALTGDGQVCAREILLPDANLRTVIRESRWNAVSGLLESAPGSISLGRAWQKQIRLNRISMDAALEAMSEREVFESRFKAELERGLNEEF